MAYGAYTGVGAAEGTPTYKLSMWDGGRAAVGGFTPLIQEVTHEITGSADLVVNVTLAGTRQRLSGSSLPIRRAIVVAHSNNRDVVVLGGATVVAALGTAGAATRRGAPLGPNDPATVDFDDLTDVWIDSVVSGDGVSIWYFT